MNEIDLQLAPAGLPPIIESNPAAEGILIVKNKELEEMSRPVVPELEEVVAQKQLLSLAAGVKPNPRPGLPPIVMNSSLVNRSKEMKKKKEAKEKKKQEKQSKIIPRFRGANVGINKKSGEGFKNFKEEKIKEKLEKEDVEIIQKLDEIEQLRGELQIAEHERFEKQL